MACALTSLQRFGSARVNEEDEGDKAEDDGAGGADPEQWLPRPRRWATRRCAEEGLRLL